MTTWKQYMARQNAYALRFPQHIANIAARAEEAEAAKNAAPEVSGGQELAQDIPEPDDEPTKGTEP